MSPWRAAEHAVQAPDAVNPIKPIKMHRVNRQTTQQSDNSQFMPMAVTSHVLTWVTIEINGACVCIR